MKFLKWLFAYGEKYRKQSVFYQKGAIAGKITSLLTVILFAAATIGTEYWCFHIFNESILAGILVFIFFVSFLKVTIDNGIVTGLCAFRCAIWGAIGDVVNKKIADDGVQIVDGEIDITEPNSDNAKQSEVKIKKSHKWLDVLIGVLSIGVTIGVFVASIAILVQAIS